MTWLPDELDQQSSETLGTRLDGLQRKTRAHLLCPTGNAWDALRQPSLDIEDASRTIERRCFHDSLISGIGGWAMSPGRDYTGLLGFIRYEKSQEKEIEREGIP